MKKILFVSLIFLSLSVFSNINKSISLGTNLNFGNLNSFNLNLQSSLSQDSGKLDWNINPNFSFTMIKNDSKFQLYERETFLTTSISKKINNWKIMTFSDIENSYLRKIIFRFSGGFGVGYDIIQTDKLRFNISEVLMPEIYISENSSKNITTIRPSTRFKLKWNSKVNFESVTYFQPPLWTSNQIRFKDNINFRTLNTFDFPVFKYLSLGLQLNIHLFTLPNYFNPDIKISDTNLSFLIRTRF